MKKILLWGLMLGVIMVMPQFINFAEAGDEWKTYKLIKDGALNTSKWEDRTVRGETTVVNLSIGSDDEGDYIEFDHQLDTSGLSAWLKLIKIPECVKGIEVKVKMGDVLVDDIRARIGTVAGANSTSKDYVWSNIALRNDPTWTSDGDRVYGTLSVLDASNDFKTIVEPIYAQLDHPTDIDGNTYTIKMIFDRTKQKVQYTVDGFGSVTYKIPEKIVPGYETFWAIGTRTQESSAQGTVRFYNEVKVLIADQCEEDIQRPKMVQTVPENDQRNVSVVVAGEQIEIKFNEAMNSWYSGCGEGEDCCPYVEVKDNETGDWILTEERFCDFNYKPSKSFVFTVPGDEENLDYNTWFRICVPKGYFSDLAGNGNKAGCFEFKTERAPEI